jgi:hypothetical protein
MYIGSRSGSGTCFVAFIACIERRKFSRIESRVNNVSEIAHETVSCYTVPGRFFRVANAIEDLIGRGGFCQIQ